MRKLSWPRLQRGTQIVDVLYERNVLAVPIGHATTSPHNLGVCVHSFIQLTTDLLIDEDWRTHDAG